MKVFAVYADVLLLYEPVWLGAFRTKYNSPHSYHITLKQPCYVEEGRLNNIKQKMASFFSSFRVTDHAITLVFDDVIIDAAGGSILLAVTQSSILHELQKKLVDALGKYAYCDPGSEAWEQNFRPHLTIAYDLAPQVASRAKREVRVRDLPNGVITVVTLVTTDNNGSEEAGTPADLSHYRL